MSSGGGASSDDDDAFEDAVSELPEVFKRPQVGVWSFWGVIHIFSAICGEIASFLIKLM